eukprot:13840938-Heterocapsa_arctica.AAC.1
MECDSVVARHPEVGFDFFVDDWQGAAMGGHNWVKHHLADAATSLRLAIEGDLECKVAVDKAAVVASSRELADELRSALVGLGGDGSLVVKNIGIDFSSGRRRACCGSKATRAKRLAIIVKRAKRLRILTRAVGTR